MLAILFLEKRCDTLPFVSILTFSKYHVYGIDFGSLLTELYIENKLFLPQKSPLPLIRINGEAENQTEQASYLNLTLMANPTRAEVQKVLGQLQKFSLEKKFQTLVQTAVKKKETLDQLKAKPHEFLERRGIKIPDMVRIRVSGTIRFCITVCKRLGPVTICIRICGTIRF